MGETDTGHRRWSTLVFVFVAGVTLFISSGLWDGLVGAVFKAGKWEQDPLLTSWDLKWAVLALSWGGALFFYRDSLFAAIRWLATRKGLLVVLAICVFAGTLVTLGASTWNVVSSHGWVAVVLAGVGGACVVLATVSLAVIAWRPAQAPAPSPVNTIAAPDNSALENVRANISSVTAQLSEARVQLSEFDRRIDRLKLELAPQDHAEELRKLESDIGRASGELAKVRDDLGKGNLDILHLLNVTVTQTTASLLDFLVHSAPKEDLNALTEGQYSATEQYLQTVRSGGLGEHRMMEFREVLDLAEADAEQRLRAAPYKDGQTPAEVLKTREWLISACQCRAVRRYLERQRREVEGKIRSQRSKLIEQLQARENPPS